MIIDNEHLQQNIAVRNWDGYLLLPSQYCTFAYRKELFDRKALHIAEVMTIAKSLPHISKISHK